MDKSFFESIMRVPTCSGHEDMMQEFLLEWAGKHGCTAKKDGKGNVYVTKGKPPAGHYYPGFCNHIDTVFENQAEMVKQHVYKAIVWEGDKATAINPLLPKQDKKAADKNRFDFVYRIDGKKPKQGDLFDRDGAVDVEANDDGTYEVKDGGKPAGEKAGPKEEEPVEMGRQTGIGADNQCGCAIALDALDSIPYGKALFVVEEEVGCRGVQAADLSFFDDCAFVFSNDSPEGNRAAKACNGLKLFSDGFFKEHLEKTCAAHGLTDFRSEPGTDIMFVRRHRLPGGKHLECLNFGNGGYNPHRDTEYAKFSETARAAELLVDLCRTIPLDRQYASDEEEERRPAWNGWAGGGSNGVWGNAFRKKDRPDWGRAPKGGAWWDEPAKAKAEPVPDDETGRFEFRFAKPERAGTAKLAVRRLQRVSKGLELEKSGPGTLAASGPVLGLKYAYMACFNAENQTSYAKWDDFAAKVPGAAEAFRKAVRLDKDEGGDDGPMSHGPEDQCSITLELMPEEVPEFERGLAGVPRTDDLMLTEEGSAFTVYGPLAAVQEAYVVFCRIAFRINPRRFADIPAGDQEDFWSQVAFDGDAPDPDDDVLGRSDFMGDDEDDASSGGDLPPGDDPGSQEASDFWKWWDSNH